MMDLTQVPAEALAMISRCCIDEMKRREQNLYRDSAKNRRSWGLKGRWYAADKEQEAYERILGQDWSDRFAAASEEVGYYVYLHVEPNDDAMVQLSHASCRLSLRGIPFYVGKGIGNRAWDLKRNQGHGRVLRKLQDRGVTPDQVVTIVSDGLTERKALELEAKLIHFFGTRYDEDRPGPLVNLDVPTLSPTNVA